MAEKGRARHGLDRLVKGKRGQSEARARSGRAEPSRAFLTLHELGELKRSGSRRPLPSIGEQNDGNNYIGNVESAETSYGLTVFENSGKPRAPIKRKHEKNDNSEDIEGYKRPWASF